MHLQCTERQLSYYFFRCFLCPEKWRKPNETDNEGRKIFSSKKTLSSNAGWHSTNLPVSGSFLIESQWYLPHPSSEKRLANNADVSEIFTGKPWYYYKGWSLKLNLRKSPLNHSSCKTSTPFEKWILSLTKITIITGLQTESSHFLIDHKGEANHPVSILPVRWKTTDLNQPPSTQPTPGHWHVRSMHSCELALERDPVSHPVT